MVHISASLVFVLIITFVLRKIYLFPLLTNNTAQHIKGTPTSLLLSYSISFCLSRMKSLEQDALKAQMVIAKSKEGKKRGALDQLSESPSPVPTPSPTPMDGEELNSDVVLDVLLPLVWE